MRRRGRGGGRIGVSGKSRHSSHVSTSVRHFFRPANRPLRANPPTAWTTFIAQRQCAANYSCGTHVWIIFAVLILAVLLFAVLLLINIRRGARALICFRTHFPPFAFLYTRHALRMLHLHTPALGVLSHLNASQSTTANREWEQRATTSRKPHRGSRARLLLVDQ